MRNFIRLLTFVLLIFVTGSCSREAPQTVSSEVASPNPEKVYSHTNGVVSKYEVVRVLFVDPMVDESKLAAALDESPIVLKPAVAGEAVWTSTRELWFTPSQPLKPAQHYLAEVVLPGVNLGAESAAFSFEFRVKEQNYWVTIEGVTSDPDDSAVQSVSGTLVTSDTATGAEIGQMVQVDYDGSSNPTIDWSHAEDGLYNSFVVKGLKRGDKVSKLSLTFSGQAIGVDIEKEESIEIAPIGLFEMLSATAIVTGDRHAEVRFSDPLDTKQDLRGRIRVDGVKDLRFTIDGNILRVYSGQPLHGTRNLRIEGIKNSAGKVLGKPVTRQVVFENPKPSVSFVGDGAILPTTNGLTVPIEVTNIRGVMVKATRVYESNIPQFMQVNRMTGTSQLNRVGKSVYEKHFPIEMGPARTNRPVRIGLDLTELVEAEPSSLLHLELRLLPSDVMADCPDGGLERFPDTNWDEPEAQSSLWDMFNWSERRENRDDPCHPAFYSRSNTVDSRNVLVSDLGIIAKRGLDGELHTVVTHLIHATPLEGVRLRALDYQFQELSAAVTDEEGRATLPESEKAFLIEAVGNDQKNWLKLDRGSALSVSHFDVGGAPVQDGMRGFIYGERGVWRPGDDIYLTFVLHSAGDAAIPEDHPVTFTLHGPRGGLIDKQTITKGVGGFYAIKTKTVPDGDTGNYAVKVKVGGATFTRSLLVETVKPNRLKIELDLDTDTIKSSKMELAGSLNSRWLHGAKAPGFKADIEANFRSTTTTFAGFGDYSFDNAAAEFDGSTRTIYSGYLDTEGVARLSSPIEIGQGAPGFLKAVLQTRVFEPSGSFSVNQASVTVSPYEQYVGIKTPKGDVARGMMLTDKTHTINIALVNEEGKRVSSGAVNVSLHKISWRWWWQQGEDYLADFSHAYGHKLIKQSTVAVTNGKGEWGFEVKYPEWGRYLLVAKDTKSGHQSTKIIYVDWPGWAGRAQDSRPGGAGVLSLTADKESVSVGDSVTLSFPMAQDARALVSLESSSEVLHTAWVEPNGETSRYTFEVTPEMAPNIFANVTMVQPHMSAGNDRPIRMYGITPIDVLDPTTKLSPTIETAASFEPESTNTVRVSEQSGRAMTYTLAVVDEGLLGLTGFKTPNPWDVFFQREALGVLTWDLYSLVSGSYGGVLESLLAVGGGADGLEREPPKANRFQPVVQYLGPFSLAAGETAKHSVEIPSYVGEVRVMVVAGSDGAYGAAEQSIAVKKPLMVLSTLPRVARPGEQVEIPVSVFVLEDEIKSVVVELKIDGAAELLSVDGPKRVLTFNSTGDQIVNFKVKMSANLGPVSFTVAAVSGKHRAEMTTAMEVELPGEPISKTVSAMVKPGASWSGQVPLVGVAPKATLEVSTTPPLDLERNLSKLIRYPHGCVEQTTSAAFPQVALTELTDLSEKEQKRVQKNVMAGIERLGRFQTMTGGYAYWPGGGQADEWATSYVGHFLLAAQQAGYAVSPEAVSNWRSYQKRTANSWVRERDRSDLQQAYRLFTLALAGDGDIGAMNRLRDLSISTSAQWSLAAAYMLVGQDKIAAQMVAGLGTEVDEVRELSGTYGSGLRDQALMLQAMGLVGDKRAADMAILISKRLSEDRIASTQTTAFSLIALSDYSIRSAVNSSIDFEWKLSGDSSKKVSSESALVSVSLPVDVNNQTPDLSITNSGSDRVWMRAISTGVPKLGQEETKQNKLRVILTYVDKNGSAVDVQELRQGRDFYAQVSVSNQSDRRLHELALTQLFPSGWEIHGLSSGVGDGFDYRVVKDDRVYIYFDLKKSESRTFKVPLNSTYLGEFYRFGPSVEAMYDASIRASEEGAWVSVVELDDQG